MLGALDLNELDMVSAGAAEKLLGVLLSIFVLPLLQELEHDLQCLESCKKINSIFKCGPVNVLLK